MAGIDKHALIAQLTADLEQERDAIARAARDAHEQATHEEARPENDKDTRGLELSYLAGAQNARAQDLGRAIAVLAAMPRRAFGAGEPASAGALVTVESDNARAVYLLASQGGGRSARVGGTTVKVLTPQSPLGAALLGAAAGDVVEVETQQGRREYEVLAVE